jgi:hypothetical protein
MISRREFLTGSVALAVSSEPVEQVVEGFIYRGRLLLEGVPHPLGVQFIQILEERAGALCRDGIRGESGTGKVFQVVCHDCFRTGADCGREDMTIFLMVCHGWNQVFVAFHPGFPKVFADLVLPVCRLLGRHAETLLQIPAYFRHDLVRPLWEE